MRIKERILYVILLTSTITFIGCSSISDAQRNSIINEVLRTVEARMPTPSTQTTQQVPLVTVKDIQEAVQSGVRQAITSLPSNTPVSTFTMPPISTSTITPTPTPKKILALTPVPSATTIPTSRPNTLRILTPIAPVPPRATRTPLITSIRPNNLDQLRIFMLDLINVERKKEGLVLVELSNNVAAQDYAEEMMEKGYSSHWGLDGMKPYMRYSLAGSEGYTNENLSGFDYYIPPCRFSYCLVNPEALLKEDMEGLMNSPGHRDNILDLNHRLVSLGIAYNGDTTSVVQVFSGGYLKYWKPPTLINGQIEFAGSLNKGLTIYTTSIYYDPEPRALTLGQLAATYCYSLGKPVALLRRPPERRWYYPDDQAIVSYGGCTDPYTVSPDAYVPTQDDIDFEAIKYIALSETTVPYTTADIYFVNERDFDISADLSPIIREQGSGVYTVLIWAQDVDEKLEPFIVSEYSIFLTSEKPD